MMTRFADSRADTAIKQIRNASDNLHRASTWPGATTEQRGMMRAANQLLAQLANALDHGPAYVTMAHAESFDLANARAED